MPSAGVPPMIARGLFEDLTPPPAPRPAVPASGQREEGAGRPTKRERRDTDRLRGRDGIDLE